MTSQPRDLLFKWQCVPHIMTCPWHRRSNYAMMRTRHPRCIRLNVESLLPDVKTTPTTAPAAMVISRTAFLANPASRHRSASGSHVNDNTLVVVISHLDTLNHCIPQPERPAPETALAHQDHLPHPHSDEGGRFTPAGHRKPMRRIGVDVAGDRTVLAEVQPLWGRLRLLPRRCAPPVNPC